MVVVVMVMVVCSDLDGISAFVKRKFSPKMTSDG